MTWEGPPLFACFFVFLFAMLKRRDKRSKVVVVIVFVVNVDCGLCVVCCVLLDVGCWISASHGIDYKIHS